MFLVWLQETRDVLLCMKQFQVLITVPFLLVHLVIHSTRWVQFPGIYRLPGCNLLQYSVVYTIMVGSGTAAGLLSLGVWAVAMLV